MIMKILSLTILIFLNGYKNADYANHKMILHQNKYKQIMCVYFSIYTDLLHKNTKK